MNDRLGSIGKIIIGAIAIVIVVVLALVFGGGGQNAQVGYNNVPGATVTATGMPQTETGTPAIKTDANPETVKSAIHPTGPGPVVLNIKFITPVANDIWKITTDNLISWTKAGGISGDLYLVNAQTGAFVGTILNEVGENQTSYTWNTRDLLVNRSSPQKITVLPGTYIIKLAYDGNNIPITTSPVFTITD